MTFAFHAAMPAANDDGEVSATIPWVTVEESTSQSTLVDLTTPPAMKARPGGRRLGTSQRRAG